MAHRSAFGITRIANLTGLDRTGVPVVMVCRPNARSSAVFNGKGVDVAAAQASGLMEAVETWHAENVRLPLQYASFADLSGRLNLVDIDGLPRSRPDAQFDRHAPILWVEGRNLMDERAIWLPFEIVHADSRDVGAADERLSLHEHKRSGVRQSSFWRRSGTASAKSLNGTPRACGVKAPRANRTRGASIWRRSTIRSLLAILDRLARRRARRRDLGHHDRRRRGDVPMLRCRPAQERRVTSGSAPHVIRGGRSRSCAPILEAAQVRTTYIIGSREDIEPADYEPAALRARNAEMRAFMRQSGGARDFQLGGERAVRHLRRRGRLASRPASVDRAKPSDCGRSDAP